MNSRAIEVSKRGSSECARTRQAVVDLDSQLVLSAAKLSVDSGLPMADSVILAPARAHQATLWTQDADCEAVEGVEYVAKTP